MRLKRQKNKYDNYKIYCDDLEKSIDQDGGVMMQKVQQFAKPV
jgi:hypothetical protein